MKDLEILDNLIIWRVEPSIYAFTTETIPNYLKIGDTYRPIEKRLNEWRKHFPNLEKKFEDIAKIDEEIFYRDYAIHQYLENKLYKSRLQKDTIKSIPYYSNEFFKNTSSEDIINAIEDIKESYVQNNSKYQYYRFDESRIPEVHHYRREEKYDPRPNQKETIKKFKNALDKGRTNLLMYAVMRFGKSFTSMCCAVEMNAHIVVVVSAKADVKNEWKKTVESHVNFDWYNFLESDSLLQSDTIINELQKKWEKIVIFLTLQDLQWDVIKSKHKEIFENRIDLLIIDETHFWARAKEYWKVLQDIGKKETKQELKLNDVSLDDLEVVTKILNADIKLHLSGTPYRILMNSEFTEDDIIAFYQFSNIAEDQEEWNNKNLLKDDIKEWDNPYYGFPQMVRFAFNPNESSRKKMEQLKNDGISYAFSEFFRPQSILKNENGLHKLFLYEKEIKDLLDVIDGSKNDDNILWFLDFSKLKEGKMCRHIVCVLPYRASCDAFEELIKNNEFKNLNSYEIINISGVENENIFKDTPSVQETIKKYEREDKKTLTLTVNKMLTGTTVPEWDTMLFLKDTSSPQEYDQATFRLQNQYIKEYKDEQWDVIKYNMKPQTLLVDFNPNRMFQMQEQKSQFYNVNTETNGNTKLEERLQRELEISPIIVMNNNKMVEVTPSDILDAVREYSSTRSVLDEAQTIHIDYSLLDIAEIRAEIERQNEINSKLGFELKASQWEWDEIDIEDSEEITSDKEDKENNKTESQEKDEDDFKWKFAMYYARLLFFSFLTDSKIKSLYELIEVIDQNDDNIRIASNLEIKKEILVIFQKYINHFVLSDLDYKIQNINFLANDENISPRERAKNALKKFWRLSDSEIVTPWKIADKLIESIPKESINTSTKFLDIASKQWEFLYAVYKKYGKDVAKNFYPIPTSKIAYEFTRKLYQFLELDVNNIEKEYTSLNLLEENQYIEDNLIKINTIPMKFDVIVWNPPYQQSDWWAQASAKPIYHHFVNIAKKLNPQYVSIIMPTRWYSGGKGLDEFRNMMLNDEHISELHDFLYPELVFPGTNNRGGVCYYLWDNAYDNVWDLTKIFTYSKDFENPIINTRSLKTEDSDILIRHSISVDILQKVKSQSNFISFESNISSLRPFGFRWYFTKDEKFRDTKKWLEEPIICYGKGKKVWYLEKSEVVKNKDWIDKVKVYTPRANNIGTELNDDNLNSFIWDKNTICTESYIVIGINLNLDKLSAENICKYFKTKFTRFQHSIGKASQDATSKTYKFIPLQDFTEKSDIDWTQSVEDIDKQLYKKYKLWKWEIEFIEKMIKPM